MKNIKNNLKKKLFFFVILLLFIVFLFVVISSRLLFDYLKEENQNEKITTLYSFESFVAFKEEENTSKVKFQFIFTDHESHGGKIELKITNGSRNFVLYERELVAKKKDFVDSAICTHVFCGIKKMYESVLVVPFRIEKGRYKSFIKFTEEEGEKKIYTANSTIEVY